MVSGSFNSPNGGSFHHSLALLGSLSVAREYLALGRGRPGFTPSFPSWVILGNAHKEEPYRFTYGAVTLYGPTFLTGSVTAGFCNFPPGVGSRTHAPHDTAPATHPRLTQVRFRLFRVRSPLLTESILFLFQQVLRCFNSLRWHPFGWHGMTRAGFPHSDIPGSKPAWRLPEAYRSLPRPSSPSGAKASPMHP